MDYFHNIKLLAFKYYKIMLKYLVSLHLLFTNLFKMKKLILSLASLCLIFSVYSCRETEKKADDAATEIEETVKEVKEEVEKEVEEVVDSTKNAVEEAVDGVKDAANDAANEAVDGAKEVVDETAKKMGDAVKEVIEN